MAEQQTIHEVNGLDIDVLKDTIDKIRQDPELARCRFHIINSWIKGNHNRTIIDTWYGARQENEHEHMFELEADEPPILAGHDQAPNPVEHLLSTRLMRNDQYGGPRGRPRDTHPSARIRSGGRYRPARVPRPRCGRAERLYGHSHQVQGRDGRGRHGQAQIACRVLAGLQHADQRRQRGYQIEPRQR